MADYGSSMHDRAQSSGRRVRTSGFVDTAYRVLRAGARVHHCVESAEPIGAVPSTPDSVVQNREEGKALLKDAFLPPLDAIKALDDMGTRVPATIEVDTGGNILRFATLWDSSKSYLNPILWTGVSTTIAQYA